MKEVIYLTLEQLLVIHEDQIERYGGSSGLRDLGLLESAIFRPQSSFGGEDLYRAIFDKAAALLHSLLMNHAFIDGNKRTAMASSLVFLEMNGYTLFVSQEDLVNAALSVHDKVWDLEKIASWLKKNSKKIKI